MTTEATAAPVEAAPEATTQQPEAVASAPAAPPKLLELAKQFEGLSPEESREALAELLKRHPLKTKHKGEEVAIADLKKIEDTVREGTAYGKLRRELAAEKEELKKAAHVIKSAIDGDQAALREILMSRPETFESAKQLIASVLMQNKALEEIPEEYREQIVRGKQMETELERYRRLERERAAEAEEQAKRAANEQGSKLIQAQIMAEAKAMDLAPSDIMMVGDLLVQNLKDNNALGNPKTPGEVLRETMEEFHDTVGRVNQKLLDPKLSPKEKLAIVGRKTAEAAAMALIETDPEFERRIANRYYQARSKQVQTNGAPKISSTNEDPRELFRKLSSGAKI